jgi:peptidoglycan-associated lipoprotein
MRSLAKIMVASLCVSLAACGGEEKRPPAVPEVQPEPTVEPTPEPVDDGKDEKKSIINIDPEIRKACGISDEDAYFAFDSARVRDQDRQVLRKLAVCFSTGPLAGRQMGLVGHADPRGESEYNMLLGERRATNVKQVIVSEGLAPDKMSTSSRGEMDATGTDEASWARDRRVDVVLAN